jgi:hypothetical protein
MLKQLDNCFDTRSMPVNRREDFYTLKSSNQYERKKTDNSELND